MNTQNNIKESAFNLEFPNDVISFNESLKKALFENVFMSKFTEKFNKELLQILLKYKPTTVEEIDEISKMLEIDLKSSSNKIISIISRMVNQFFGKYPEVSTINIEERKVLTNLYLRNIDVSIENNMINPIKDTNILLENIKKEKIRTSDIENLILDNEDSIKLEDSKNLIDLYDHQENSRGNWRNNSLFLSIGTIKGKLPIKEFSKLNTNSPLLLIPVVLIFDEENENYSLQYDAKRNFSLNKDIIVTMNLHNELNYNDYDYKLEALMEDISDFETIDELINEVKSIYELHNITFENTDKLKINPEIYLGNFEAVKNPTMHDLNLLLNSGFISKNIKSLTSNKNTEENESLILGQSSPAIEERKNKLIANGEYEIQQITKLNYSQEVIVKNVNVYDDIIIQGPPGTGKTESIVSIIADAISRNKKVLVSSEKHVALELIHKRLIELSKYSILLTNIEDTISFYDQLQNMLSEATNDIANQSNSFQSMSDNEIIFRRNEVRNEIYDYIKSYETIFKYLKSNEIGKTYSYLYKNHASHRTNEKEIKAILDKSTLIETIRKNKLFVPKLYDVLYMLNEKFSYKADNSEFDLDLTVLNKYPFLITHTRKNITIKKIDSVLNRIQNFTNENLFSGNRFSNSIISILNKVFKNPEHLYSYISDIGQLKIILNILSKKVKYLFNQVEKDSKSEIFQTLGSGWMAMFNEIAELLISKNKKINPAQISGLIFDDTILKIIELKESSNTELQSNISNGNISTFTKMISKGIDEIIESNITLVERKLRDSLLENMVKSGKMMQIQTYIETNKFEKINKFLDVHWKEIFKSVNIWLLSSNEVSSFFPLEPGLFDITIIDEASQLQTEKALPIMFRSKKLVILGDDKQLKPSINPKTKLYWNEREMDLKNVLISPFGLQDALKTKFPNFLLNYHYRSVYSELINFSNAFIYKNKLHVSTPKAYDVSNPPIEWITTPSARMVNNKNAKETKAVIKRLISLIKENPNVSVGVVTLTHEQKHMIDEAITAEAKINKELDLFLRINDASSSLNDDKSFFVKEVSEVQGDERDTIIFSFGYAKLSNGKMPTHFGTVSEAFGENKLNVAITRAKEKIIVVQSMKISDIDVPKTDIGGNLLKYFLYYSEAVGTGAVDKVKRILKTDSNSEIKVFESKMHEEIFYLIKDAGYDVEYKFGLDKYKVDFAIKNETGDVVLGIELDGEQYLRNFRTMEREYYLPTFLEVRGWNLLKVWSHQWAKDPIGSNNLILETIKKAIIKKGQNEVYSLNDSNVNILDFDKIEDKQYDTEEKIVESVTEKGEKLIEERFKDFSEIKKILKSNKEQQEEDRWLAEFEALEAQKASKPSGTEELIERQFLLNDGSKSIEGIEDPEIDELIKLSEMRQDFKRRGKK